MNAQDQDSIDLIKEYCEGYENGFIHGQSARKDDDLVTAVATVARSTGNAERLGFSEGFAAGRRAKYAEPERERLLKEYILEEVGRLEWDLGQFNDEQRERWNDLQKQIVARGDKSWQQILLDLYRHLNLFEGLAKMTEDEKTALHLLRKGVLIRLSRTPLSGELRASSSEG